MAEDTGARLRDVPGAGHRYPVDAADAIVEAVRDAVGARGATSAPGAGGRD